MTITTVAINCDVSLANNTEFTASQLEFTLSDADYDTISNDSVPAATVVLALDASGVATANLWPVDRGTRNTFYRVVLIGTRTINGRATSERFALGNIAPPSTGAPFALADLLGQSTGGIVVGSTIYETLAAAVQAALDAADAAAQSAADAQTWTPAYAAEAVADAEAARDAAAASAMLAEAFAVDAAGYDPTLRFSTIGLMGDSTRSAAGVAAIWQAGPDLFEELAPSASVFDIQTAGGVKLRRITVAQFSSQRGLRGVLDAAEPINGIRDEVVIEKRRTDFIEFAVYSPIERTGREWIRHFSSVRLLPGSVGAPDYTIGTLAYLYASTAVAPFGATGGAGITAASPSATVDGAAATSRTGTWTGPVTVSGVANSYWTATTGDSVVYTITVPAGGIIYHEGPGVFSNGGIAEVVVRLSGTEITAGEYLARLSSGVRIADYRAPNNTLAIVPLARVTSAGTYTVTLTRSAQSPASGRLYDTRVRAFNPIAFNAPGVYGAVIANSDPGSASDLSYATGTTIVYQCPNATRIGWRYWRNTVCGQVQFRVFNNSGVEIGSYVTSTLDMFGSALPLEVEVCRGLARGTYWLHVTVLTTRNASSTDNRMYARGPVAYDETTAGTVGTHAFDILDMPASPSAGDFGTNVLSGPGNHWYASQWRPTAATSWPAGDNFVTGVHGEETSLTNANLTVKVDGVTVAWNAAAAGATFTGREIVVEFTTTLSFPGTATPFATLARKITYRRGGVVLVETTRTLTASATMGSDYVAMLQAPNGGNTQSAGVGGGFANWAAERSRNFLLNTSAGTGTEDSPWSEAFACWNSRYASYVALMNPAQVQSQYAGQMVGWNNVLMQDNTSHAAKAYLLSAGGGQPAAGVPLPSGHVSRVVKIYRTLPCRDADVLCAA